MKLSAKLTPSFPSPYTQNSIARHAVFSAKFARRFALPHAYCGDLNGSQFCIAMGFSERSILPPLRNLVIVIVFLGAEKQVLRTNTVGDIAFMTDLHSARNRTEVNHPRKSVYEYLMSAIANICISIISKSTRPEPASLSLIDVSPEPTFYGTAPTMPPNKPPGIFRRVFGPSKRSSASTGAKATFAFIVTPASFQNKVCWVHAKRVIADRMIATNRQAIRDRTVMNFPRDAARFECVAVVSNLPTSVLTGATCPQPAFIWATLVDLFPEALVKWSTRGMPLLILRNKPRALSIEGGTATALTKANKRDRMILHDEDSFRCAGRGMFPHRSGVSIPYYTTPEEQAA